MSINVSSNFLLGAGLPLDARTVVANATARLAIPSVERYDGLVVYQVDTTESWALSGGVADGNWITLPGKIRSATPSIAAFKKLWPNTVTGTPVVSATLTQPGAGQLQASNFNNGSPQSGDVIIQESGVIVSGSVTGTPTVGATLAQPNSGVLETPFGFVAGGGVVVVGATLLQAITGATGTVAGFYCRDISGSAQIVLNLVSVTGTFNTINTVTGTNPNTSTFTFVPPAVIEATTATVLSQTSLGGSTYRFTLKLLTGYFSTTATVTGTNPNTSTYTYTPASFVQTTATVISARNNGSPPTVMSLSSVVGAFNTIDGCLNYTTDISVVLYSFTPSSVTTGGIGTISAITTGGLGTRWNLTSTSGVFNTVDTCTGTNPDTSTFTFVPKSVLLDVWPISGASISAPTFSYDAGNSYGVVGEFINSAIQILANSNGLPSAIWISADSEWESAVGSLITPTFQWL